MTRPRRTPRAPTPWRDRPHASAGGSVCHTISHIDISMRRPRTSALTAPGGAKWLQHVLDRALSHTCVRYCVCVAAVPRLSVVCVPTADGDAERVCAVAGARCAASRSLWRGCASLHTLLSIVTERVSQCTVTTHKATHTVLSPRERRPADTKHKNYTLSRARHTLSLAHTPGIHRCVPCLAR